MFENTLMNKSPRFFIFQIQVTNASVSLKLMRQNKFGGIIIHRQMETPILIYLNTGQAEKLVECLW